MKRLLLMLMLSGVNVLAIFPQVALITGTVGSSAEGSGPLNGVTVLVKGTTIGVTTDVDGKYAIGVPPGSTTLIFSFVGMRKQEVEVGGRSIIDIILEPDVLGLDEVVITALGISRERKALGYSVTDIKGATLTQIKESNIINLFQGKLAGVQITNNSGAVGSSSQLLIRGVRSFGDNEALWVVDGTPISNMTNGANPLGGVDYGNAAADLDPENIESVSILKGASSAALYGSRARNGVVLITTKKGPAKKGAHASFSNTTMFNQVSRLPAYQNEYGQGWNGSEYSWKIGTAPGMPAAGMSYQNWAAETSFKYIDGLGGGINDKYTLSWGPRMDAGLIIDQFFGKAQPWVSHPDNVRSFFVTGLSETNNLELSGSSDNLKARLSYTNVFETGTVPNTDQKRNLLNAATTMNLSSKININLNLNYIETSNGNLGAQGYSVDNPMSGIEGWYGRQVDMRLLKEHWQEWMPNGYPYNWTSALAQNPYWSVYRNTTERNRERVFGNVGIEYIPVPWLNLTGRYGVDHFNEFRKSVIYEGSYLKPVGTGGSFSQNKMENKEINADFLASAHKQFSDYKISVTMGANYRQHDYSNLALSATELTVPNFFHITNVKGWPGSEFYESHYKTRSVYGSFNASFRDYLYLDATFRNDWSSTLPKNNRSYLYPSISMSWLFTEFFGLEKSIIPYGKIRASYSVVGSDTEPYALTATYMASIPFNGLSQYNYPLTIPPENRTLKPELSKSFEIGTELKFFMNRISLDFSFYDTKTSNQIFSMDVSPSSGFSKKTANIGEIQSYGYEVSLIGEILHNPTGLNWTAIVNWSTQNSLVNRLHPGVASYILNSSVAPVTIEARPGQKFGDIYGSGYQRDSKGRILVQDGLPLLTTENIYLGNIMPDWIASVFNKFTFRNLSFTLLIDGRIGGDLFSITKQTSDEAGITEATVKGGIRENGMVFDGIDMASNQKNEVRIDPAFLFNIQNWTLSEPAIIDGSFIKLREIVLGYRLPLSTKFVSNINFSMFGRNLALIYRDKSNDIRIDPETAYGSGALACGIESFQIPSSRSIGFKLNFDF